jgi:hypothetical protein
VPKLPGMPDVFRWVLALWAFLAVPGAAPSAVQTVEESLRHEGEAVLALADAAAQSDPTDFAVSWHNDFLKAQNGTFVPFVIEIRPPAPSLPDPRSPAPDPRSSMSAALLYIRVTRRAPTVDERRAPDTRGATDLVPHPFEEIRPVALVRETTRVTRGFAIAPGEYDVTIVVRQRERQSDGGRRRLAAVVRRPLSVPDYSEPVLTTSTIMLADRITVVPPLADSADLSARPYVIGTREIEPAADAVLRRDEELIVVFLVYNPFVTEDKHFDLEVEYHFFWKNGRGAPGAVASTVPGVASLPDERYVNRTEPQRFTPTVLGPQFDPSAGQPVMAGQGVPLAGFEEGEYRLAIKVTDMVSRRSIERHLLFTVRS